MERAKCYDQPQAAVQAHDTTMTTTVKCHLEWMENLKLLTTGESLSPFLWWYLIALTTASPCGYKGQALKLTWGNPWRLSLGEGWAPKITRKERDLKVAYLQTSTLGTIPVVLHNASRTSSVLSGLHLPSKGVKKSYAQLSFISA